MSKWPDWTTAEHRVLRYLWERGVGTHDIAAVLERPVNSLRHQRRRIGLPRRRHGQRILTVLTPAMLAEVEALRVPAAQHCCRTKTPSCARSMGSA